MNVDPGRLRTKLTYQTSDETAVNSVGQPVEDWQDAFDVWAEVVPLNAREQFWAQQAHATTTHKLTMRYDARITSLGRFALDGRVLAIDGVIDIEERRRFMTATCTEQA